MTATFLSRVGERERSPLRWAVWLILAALLLIAGAIPLGAVLAAMQVDSLVAAVGEGALPEGPRRLILETQFTFVLGMTLALFAVAILVAARLAFHRPAWTFVTPAAPFRFRLLLAGFLVLGALALVGLFIERALRGEPLDPPLLDADYALGTRLIYAAGSALFLLLAAAAEEIVFRGVVLQVTAARVRAVFPLVLINGLAFSAIHLDPSPEAFAARALSGAVWAWTVLRLGGLEFAIGAHLANNLVIALLIDPISEGAQPGRDYPLAVMVFDAATMGLLVVCLLAALRSPRLCAWAGIAPAGPRQATID